MKNVSAHLKDRHTQNLHLALISRDGTVLGLRQLWASILHFSLLFLCYYKCSLSFQTKTWELFFLKCQTCSSKIQKLNMTIIQFSGWQGWLAKVMKWDSLGSWTLWFVPGYETFKSGNQIFLEKEKKWYRNRNTFPTFLKHVTKCSWTVPISLIMQSNKQINFKILVSTCDYVSAIYGTSKASTFIFTCVCVCLHITCVCKYMHVGCTYVHCVDTECLPWFLSTVFPEAGSLIKPWACEFWLIYVAEHLSLPHKCCDHWWPPDLTLTEGHHTCPVSMCILRIQALKPNFSCTQVLCPLICLLQGLGPNNFFNLDTPTQH